MIYYQDQAEERLASYSRRRNLRNGRRKDSRWGKIVTADHQLQTTPAGRLEKSRDIHCACSLYYCSLSYIYAQMMSCKGKLWLLTLVVAKRDGADKGERLLTR